MLKLARWLETVWKNSPKSSNNFLFFQANADSPTSLICGLACMQGERTIGKPKPVLYDAVDRKGRYSYVWNSIVWPPRSIVRSNSKASKFQDFPAGACPQTPLAVACLHTHQQPDHFKRDGYCPVSLVIRLYFGHLYCRLYVNWSILWAKCTVWVSNTSSLLTSVNNIMRSRWLLYWSFWLLVNV